MLELCGYVRLGAVYYLYVAETLACSLSFFRRFITKRLISRSGCNDVSLRGGY